MSDVRSLVGKLTGTCRKSLESAAALCVTKTNFTVELDHFLLKLVEKADPECRQILTYYAIDTNAILKELSFSIDRMPRGNTSTPALSPHILTLLEEAWILSSLRFNQTFIRSGPILLAALDSVPLRGILLENCPHLLKIPRDDLRQNMPEFFKVSPESEEKKPPKLQEFNLKKVAAPSNEEQTLETYSVDLVQLAREGKIEKIFGRDSEIRQLMDILGRRQQNNPILVGDAGVGKTAIVEGLAQRIASGMVPPPLRNVSLRTLDLGLLQAGAGMKGEFEDRLQRILMEVKASPAPIILFIDEAHTLIGAGGAAGSGDAANLLKPALARGELRTIAATTWGEYKKYIEKDPALSRRFELVKVHEPSTEVAIAMLRPVAQSLARHHGVVILDEAVQAAVHLSQRFLPQKRLPDKGVSILDTACAQVSLALSSYPEPLESLINQVHLLKIQMEFLQKETEQMEDHSAQINQVQQEINDLQKRIDELQAQWQTSQTIVQQITDLQKKILYLHQNADEITYLKDKLKEMKEILSQEGLEISIPHCVDQGCVARVISSWTGIPVDIVLRHDKTLKARDLEKLLSERVIGQSYAIKQIARQLVSYRSGLSDPTKPMGVFLLLGPSGVGKTETAQVLSEILTGSQRNLLRFNMTEFQESHSIATLKGAPPGYVGYGKGGVLTEGVRQNPYSVLLFDEIEKAHPDVMELFYQVFDKGILEDSEGIEVDFTNTLIILTSNIASDEIMGLWQENNLDSCCLYTQESMDLIYKTALKHFQHAFLARLSLIPFSPLGTADLYKIIRLKLSDIEKRLKNQHNLTLRITEGDILTIAEECHDPHHGARAIDHVINRRILPDLSNIILERSYVSSEKISLSDVLGSF
jgi:type VI secretion system protein VasG